MSKVYCEKIDLENLDLKRVYTFEEFEYINDQLKTRTIQLNGKPINLFEYENGKLIPMPLTPYARAKIVSEIGRQLANWNIETHQNGSVTLSQGGFDFNVGGMRTIRAPDVAFTPRQTTCDLNTLQNWTFQGQPFTPIFVVEVDFITSDSELKVFDNRFRNEFFAPGTSVELGFLISIGQDNTGQLKRNIHSWRWYENNTVRHYEHGWINMDTRVNGQEILPGFVLDVDMIEEVISQVCCDDLLLLILF
jgi:Uma2 family endonuclease